MRCTHCWFSPTTPCASSRIRKCVHRNQGVGGCINAMHAEHPDRLHLLQRHYEENPGKPWTSLLLTQLVETLGQHFLRSFRLNIRNNSKREVLQCSCPGRWGNPLPWRCSSAIGMWLMCMVGVGWGWMWGEERWIWGSRD